VTLFDARTLAGVHSLAAGDDGCPDCALGRLSARGQACPVFTGPIADSVDNVVASAAEGGCCDSSPKGLSARGQACPIPTGPIADNEDNVAIPAAEGDCCSDCAGPTAENKDIVDISTVNPRASI
jgi:hypothetical protein